MSAEDDPAAGASPAAAASGPMRIALLLLDERPTLDREAYEALLRYIQAFLCVEVEVVEVPALPIAPKGWRSLSERLRREHPQFKHRPGRQGSGVDRQLLSPQLLELLKTTKADPRKVDVPALEGTACVLALTGCEFFENAEGLFPGQAVPEDRTLIYTIASIKQRVGAVSVARLDGRRDQGGPGRRKFIRQLLTLVSHTLLDLLHMRTCQSHQCLAYVKPFSPDQTSMNLCCNCEETLLRLTKPRGGAWDQLVLAAADRYRDLADGFRDLGAKLEPIRFSRRVYAEFEEDVDWLRIAEEILRESAAERKKAMPGAPEGSTRRRSLLNCLRCAHEGQPHRTLKRTFTQPILKRTCLVDMSQSAPFRHNCGDLLKWTHVVTNRKHEAGGHYVELGGSLRQKKIGSFVDSGLNASLAFSGQAAHLFRHHNDSSYFYSLTESPFGGGGSGCVQKEESCGGDGAYCYLLKERLRQTALSMPVAWRNQRVSYTVELPKIRARTRSLEL